MNCTLVTPRVHDFIRRARPSRILHIFDEVINLANDIGGVISLSTMEIGPGPFSLIMDNDFPNIIQLISLQDPVIIHPETLSITIGSLYIETAKTTIWNPVPPWGQFSDALILTHSSERIVSPEIDILLQNLMDAIFIDDYAVGRQATTALAGLGSGLTPSGDDVLMGVLYALQVWIPNTVWIDLIADWASPLTTTLSAAYLRAAFCGEATYHWHNLVDRQPDAVDQILSIGHTSGHDAWAGFTATYLTLHRQS